jgi:hypothetical protein
LEDAVLLFGADERLVMAGKAAERYVGLGRWEMLGDPGRTAAVLDASGALVSGSARLNQPLRNHPLILKQPDGREAGPGECGSD